MSSSEEKPVRRRTTRRPRAVVSGEAAPASPELPLGGAGVEASSPVEPVSAVPEVVREPEPPAATEPGPERDRGAEGPRAPETLESGASEAREERAPEPPRDVAAEAEREIGEPLQDVYSFSPDDEPPAGGVREPGERGGESGGESPEAEAGTGMDAEPGAPGAGAQPAVGGGSQGGPQGGPGAAGAPGGGGPWQGGGYWRQRKQMKRQGRWFEKRFGKPYPGAAADPVAGVPEPVGGEPVASPPAPMEAPPAETPEPRETRDPGEGRDPRGPREGREPRDPREIREGREPRQGGEPREGRHGRDPRDGRGGREGREGREGRGGRDFREREGRGPTPPVGVPPPPPPAYPDPTGFVDLAAMAAQAAELSGGGDPVYVDEIVARSNDQLAGLAREMGLTPAFPLQRRALVIDILRAAAAARKPLLDRGVLDTSPEGHGFVVHPGRNYRLDAFTTVVPGIHLRHLGLRRGVEIEVQVEPPGEDLTAGAALTVRSVLGGPPEEAGKLPVFEELVPYYPLRRILLEVPDGPTKDVSMRTVDLLTPIGFGQRGLIVAPPRTGKTVLMQNMANSVAKNYPEAKLIVLLVDERPEEVTDFRRVVRGEVVSSTFDETAENHVTLAEIVIERARRLVEAGKDVVILLDSITRLARAYNVLASNSGKIMSGGVEASALQKPKRFFGSARNIENGGSLTIIGSALIDTGSKMDEVIFEEFKGTGNMELHLDRGLVEKRVFPALNMDKSGTRKEELIYHPEEMQRIYALRRAMQGVPPVEAMDMLIGRLKKTKTNIEFLMTLNR